MKCFQLGTLPSPIPAISRQDIVALSLIRLMSKFWNLPLQTTRCGTPLHLHSVRKFPMKEQWGVGKHFQGHPVHSV